MDEATLHLLLSSNGQALLAELAGETIGAEDELRIITRYRARYDASLVAAALAQTKLRLRARAKFSRADQMYFTQAGLEQASTERMARYHARRFAPFNRIVDLCSGLGGDLIGLAESHPVVSVDIDPVHLRMGVLNAGAYGIGGHVQPTLSDVRDFDVSSVDAVFIDPARRADGERFQRGESEPPLEWCLALGDSGMPVGIKASPTLPLNAVSVASPEGFARSQQRAWSFEFVSERRELKECILWSRAIASHRRRATVLVPEQHTLEGGNAGVEVREPGDYLLDPDPAVTCAGLVGTLAERLGDDVGDVWNIDQDVAFLSARSPMVTPFGRCLRIEASLPWNLNRLKEALRSLDVGVVDIRKRGSAVDVDEIQRRLKLTGSRVATVVLTRVSDKPWAFVCTDG